MSTASHDRDPIHKSTNSVCWRGLQHKRIRVRGLAQGLIASLMLHGLVLLGVWTAMPRPRPASSAWQCEGTLTIDNTDDVALLITPLEPSLTEDSSRAGQGTPEEWTQTFISTGGFLASPLGSTLPAIGPPGPGTGDGKGSLFSAARSRLALHGNRKVDDSAHEITLVWDGPSNLDLFVVIPAGTYVDGWYNFSRYEGNCPTIIYWNTGRAGVAYLDITSNNARPYINEPIEHIYLSSAHLPPGDYRVFVHGQKLRPASKQEKRPRSVPFAIEIRSPSGVQLYSGKIKEGETQQIDTLTLRNNPEQDP